MRRCYTLRYSHTAADGYLRKGKHLRCRRQAAVLICKLLGYATEAGQCIAYGHRGTDARCLLLLGRGLRVLSDHVLDLRFRIRAGGHLRYDGIGLVHHGLRLGCIVLFLQSSHLRKMVGPFQLHELLRPFLLRQRLHLLLVCHLRLLHLQR